MRSKFLISYTIDNTTNLIGYDNQEERDGAMRQYSIFGILIDRGTRVHPDCIDAFDKVGSATFKPIH